jgi:polysaccharide pyruvyl transferase WcaK-like protein
MINMKKIVVLNDTRSEYHHGCSRVMNVIDYNTSIRGGTVSYFPVELDWSKSEEIKKSIAGSDILLVNGEGTIHHNSEQGFRLVQAAKFAKLFNVKCFLINCTYQANSEDYTQYLKYFDEIYVRESLSKEELVKQGISSTVVPDLTFAIEDTIQNKTGSSILVTDSVRAEVSSTLKKLFSNKDDVVFSSIFNQNYRAKPSFSIVERLKGIYRNNSLRLIVIKLSKIFSNFFHKSENIASSSQSTHDLYASFLKGAKIVVCGRFHTMTMCINQSIPFIAIDSNSHKVRGTLIDIGLDTNRFISDIKTIEYDNVINYRLNDDDLKLMQIFSNNAKYKINKMFDEIFK